MILKGIRILYHKIKRMRSYPFRYLTGINYFSNPLHRSKIISTFETELHAGNGFKKA